MPTIFEKLAKFLRERRQHPATGPMLDALAPSYEQEDFEPDEIVDIVQRQLALGADPNGAKETKARSIEDGMYYPTLFQVPQTALALAVLQSNPQACRILIEAGADFNQGVLEAAVKMVNFERRPRYTGGWRTPGQPRQEAREISSTTQQCLELLGACSRRSADLNLVLRNDFNGKRQSALKILRQASPGFVAEIQAIELEETTPEVPADRPAKPGIRL